MNKEYINSQPEVENKYNVDLLTDEKVIFTPELDMVGTEKGRLLGISPLVTLTNQRIIIDNTVGVWTIDILQDINSCKKAESGKWIFKRNYLLIDLNNVVEYDGGKQSLTGFSFYFKKTDTTSLQKIEEIMNH